MGTHNRYTGIDPYAAQIIRHKARALVGRAGFVEDDREDLEQELVLDLLRRLPKYDPTRAQRCTFIARVVEHKAANLIQGQKAGIRDYRRRAFSLDEDVQTEDRESYARMETLNPDDCARNAGRFALPADEQRQLTREVDRVLAGLPSDLRRLAERLGSWSVTEISRRSGIPRGTIYESIGRLRARFVCAGLRDEKEIPTVRSGRR